MSEFQLAPHPTPLGLFPPFFARQTETLMMKEKMLSLSGDSFDVKTVNGQPLFQVKGDVFSLSGRKHFMDMNGRELFTIRKRLLSLHMSFYAEDPSGNIIFEVKGKFSIGTSKAVCTFTSQSGRQESLLLKGNFFDTKVKILDEATTQPIAIIDRQLFNARQLLGGQQTYAVTVAPNVDLALVAAMCVCFDERQNENK